MPHENSAYRSQKRTYEPVLLSLGIAYISSVLKKAGHDVYCHNNALEENNHEAFIEQLKTVRPEAIGIGGLTPSYKDIKNLIDIAKEMLPQIPVVVGGGVLSSEPDVFTSLGADVGLIGEGEVTSVALFEALENGDDLAGVEGIMCQDPSGDVIFTPPRALIKDLDTIPYPDYGGFNLQARLDAIGTVEIISSRGCPFSCSFCWSAMGRNKYRVRSLDNFFGEIDLLRDGYNIKTIGVMDELFSAKPKRVKEFCKRIKPYNLSWYTQLRVDSIDAETLAIMKDAGCYYVFYGLESMDPTVLKSMNKRISPQLIDKVMALSHEAKLNIFGNFIFGDPMETEETAKTTLRWWLANRRYRVNLGKIDCWPGTRIYHDALERGIIEDKIKFIEEGCPIINMTHESNDIFWKKILHRIWSLHESMMVWPAKLLRVTRFGQGEGIGYRIKCICPHCAETIENENSLAIGDSNDRDAISISCSSCIRKFDIPIRLPEKSYSNEINKLFDKGLQLAKQGDTAAAYKAIEAVKHKEPTHAGAWLWLGRHWLKYDDPDQAFENIRHCSRYCCMEPEILGIFGLILKRQGEDWLTVYYLQQAHILEKTRISISVEGGIMHPEPTAEEVAALDDDPIFIELGLSYATHGKKSAARRKKLGWEFLISSGFFCIKNSQEA